MSTLDYHPYYQIGQLLGQDLFVPRCPFGYLGHNVTMANVIWGHDKNVQHPAILSIRHCLKTYFSTVTKTKYADIPKIEPWEDGAAWIDTGVRYEHQASLFDQFKKARGPSPDPELEWEFEEWVQCVIAEFLINHFPEVLNCHEKHIAATSEKILELNQIALIPLEISEYTVVNLFTLVR